ncbi:MAG: heavy metal transporter [Sulfurovaceae bacterium]|nr:heavy metal transporter [Sulfurovaceae bacterium]
MKQTFEVLNVKCNGCANTLKTKLAKQFGNVEVNLESMPRQITLDIEPGQMDELRNVLKTIGYPLSDEDLSAVENATTKAKSFISCAIGKMNT